MQKALKIRLDTSKTRRLCPNEISIPILRGLMGEKNRLKAERARFLSRRERRAKPETEPLLPRWGKRCVFLNPKAGAYGFLNTQPDLS
jgi:hypothetical protein